LDNNNQLECLLGFKTQLLLIYSFIEV